MSAVRSIAAVLTATVLVLALGRPSLGAPISSSPAVPAALKYLPGDTNLFFVIRMEQVLASEGFKKVRKDIPRFDEEFSQGFRKEFGFDIANVDLMIYGGNVKGNNRPVGVFQLKNAVTPDVLIKARSEPRYTGDKGTTFTEEKIGSVTLYVASQEYRESFCLLNDKTLLNGKDKALRALLGEEKKPALGMAMQAAIKEADFSATVAMVMDLKTLLANERFPMIPGVDYNKIADSVSGAAISVKLGKEVVVGGVAVCKDAASAEEVKTQVAAIQMFAIKKTTEVPPNVVPKEVLDVPGQIKLAAQGSLGVATLTVKEDVAIEFLKATMIGTVKEARPDLPPQVEAKPPQVEKKP